MTNTEKIGKMIIQLDLSPEMEKCLNHLEKISGKSKEFIITEALIRYIEDMADIEKVSAKIKKGAYKNFHTLEEWEKKKNLK